MPDREPEPAPPPSSLPASVTVLAFDFGEQRIGVAVGETALRSAQPLEVIAAGDNSTRFAAIARLVVEWRPGLLVVGLPFHPDGAEHEVTRLARRFARRLEGRLGLPVAAFRERGSTRHSMPLRPPRSCSPTTSRSAAIRARRPRMCYPSRVS
jgi:putative Holliday junction resolvase